jgi:hypothetical protein
MSNQEFENYLALLGGLLRLDGKQRQQIAAELRDHFEERLDDLLARGLSREEAISEALREFGDAAGLAAAFSSLARNRKRRWIVRISSLSAAATLVVVFIMLAAFWPENRPGPQPPGAIAQQPAGPPAEKAPVVAKAGNASASEQKLKAALALRVSVEFLDTALTDVLASLSEQHDMQIYINTRALADSGAAADSPISIRLKDVRVETLLDLVLDQVGGLTYVERDGVLIVSTIDALAGASEVKVYNCRDLLGLAKEAPPGEAPAGGPDKLRPAPALGVVGFGGLGGGDPSQPRMLTEAEYRSERLMGILTNSIEPSSWAEQGGFGTVSEFNGLLVVNHNARTQQQVEKVLTMLREAAGLPMPPTVSATASKKAG